MDIISLSSLICRYSHSHSSVLLRWSRNKEIVLHRHVLRVGLVKLKVKSSEYGRAGEMHFRICKTRAKLARPCDSDIMLTYFIPIHCLLPLLKLTWYLLNRCPSSIHLSGRKTSG